MSDKKSKFSIKKYGELPVLKKTAAQAAGGLGGLGIAYGIDKAVNAKKSWVVPLVTFGVSLFGLHHFNVNPPKAGDTLMEFIQGATAGGTVYGGLKTIEYGVKKVVASSGVNGLRGFISAETAGKVLRYLPTFNGVGSLERPSGYYDDPMAAMMGAAQSPDYYLPAYTPTVINGPVEGEFQVAEVL